ncbi:MAG: cation transporting ATPase C-terminal domain-containing protein [Candidatus Ozemobacteraceae bacterium]
MKPPRFWVAGLSREEARRRLVEEHAPSKVRTPSVSAIFMQRWEDPIIRLLSTAALIAAIVGAYRGEFVEFIGLFLTILLTTVVGTFNEYQAISEFSKLEEARHDTPIKVIRSGDLEILSRRLLVRGDCVLLEAGDEAPACGNLIHANGLSIDGALVSAGEVTVGAIVTTGRGILELSSIYHGSFYPKELSKEESYQKEVSGKEHSKEENSKKRSSNKENSKKENPVAESPEEALFEGFGMDSPLGRQLERLGALVGMGGLAASGTAFVLLIIRRWVNGELLLTNQGWIAVSIIGTSLSAATISIWLPFFYTMLRAVGIEVTTSGLFTERGWKSWGFSIVRGLGAFLPLVGLAALAGFISPRPWEWLSASAAEMLLQDLMFSLAIIIVAVPDGLGMSVTLSLAGGLRRMMAARALARTPGAAETVGAVSRLVIDQGPPLTTGIMRLVALDVPAVPCLSRFLPPEEAEARLFLEAVSVATTAHLSPATSDLDCTVIGNPSEGALLRWLQENGFDYLPFRNTFTVIGCRGEDGDQAVRSVHGVSVTTGRPILYARGDPFPLLALCSHVWSAAHGFEPLSRDRRAAFERYFAALHREGRTILGFAAREGFSDLAEEKDKDSVKERPDRLAASVPNNLVWLGCAAFEDIPVTGAKEAVRSCREAGIRLTLVSPHSQVVAGAFAARIGILDREDGPEAFAEARALETLSPADARRVPVPLRVVANARSDDKRLIVDLYERMGESVAVTGGRLTDVTALRSASLGISLGAGGTAAARAASELVLLDDAISGFECAVMWGRSLYDNIRRFLVFQLTINVFAVAIELLGPFIGVRMPLTVAQMLWLNLVMDTLAPIALAAEPPRQETMTRSPRDLEASILSPEMLVAILGTAGVFVVVSVALLLSLGTDGAVSTGDLTLFFTVSVLFQFWNLFNARAFGLENPRFPEVLANKAFMVIASVILLGQFAIVQFGGTIFGTVPLDASTWIYAFLGTAPVLLLGTLWTRLFPAQRGRERRRH